MYSAVALYSLEFLRCGYTELDRQLSYACLVIALFEGFSLAMRQYDTMGFRQRYRVLDWIDSSKGQTVLFRHWI